MTDEAEKILQSLDSYGYNLPYEKGEIEDVYPYLQNVDLLVAMEKVIPGMVMCMEDEESLLHVKDTYTIGEEIPEGGPKKYLSNVSTAYMKWQFWDTISHDGSLLMNGGIRPSDKDLLGESYFPSGHPMDKWFETFIHRQDNAFVQHTARIRDDQTSSQINEIVWVPNY